LTSAMVPYTHSGASAVATTVQAKLRESVSVKDFGAVGDGAIAADGTTSGTDDTAAIAAAKVVSDYIYLPKGSYLCSTAYDENTEFSGPGRIIYTGGANHPEIHGTVIPAGDYRNIGGRNKAGRAGGFLAGGNNGSGLLMAANEHPFWQIWRTIGEQGSLHWDILPNVPVVNVTSASHGGGTDTKLTANIYDFSNGALWHINQLIHFNLAKYRIKEIIDDDNIVLGTDAATPLSVAWGSAVTDNCIAPQFNWNVVGDITGTNTLTITSGDHPPGFGTYDYTNHRVWMSDDAGTTWYECTASVSSTVLTVSGSPSNSTETACILKLIPDYSFQIGLKRAADGGIEETLRIEVTEEGYSIDSRGGDVAVTKPIVLRIEGEPTVFLDATGLKYGFNTATPNDFFDLYDSTADANISIRMANDAQTWRAGLAGSSADRYIIRDVTNTTDVVRIDVGATLDSIYIGSDRVKIGGASQFVEHSDGGRWYSGTGTPESSVTAPVGSLYTRTDGGASTTLYVKESGSGNTGWIAK